LNDLLHVGSVIYSVEAVIFGGEEIVPQTSFYAMALRKITAVSVIIFWNMKLQCWGNKNQTFGGISYFSIQSGR